MCDGMLVRGMACAFLPACVVWWNARNGLGEEAAKRIVDSLFCICILYLVYPFRPSLSQVLLLRFVLQLKH